MAVKSLQCPYCGGVIETFDETMQKGFCPFCDKLIEDVQERQAEMVGIATIEQAKTKQKKHKNWKIVLPISIIAVVAIVAIMIFTLNPTLTFNEEEKKAIQAVELVQERLLNPQSITLYAVYCWKIEDEYDTYKFIFDYGAENKGGGITEASAVIHYENGEYKIQATSDGNKDKLEQSAADLTISYCLSEAHPLNTEKIQKAIK